MAATTLRMFTSTELKKMFELGERFTADLTMAQLRDAIIVVKHLDQPVHRQAKARHTFESVGYNTAVQILEDGLENVQIRFVSE